MPRLILGIVLILVGAWAFHAGWARKDSLMGSLAKAGADIANTFDGGSRTPKHYLFLGGGAVLVAGGVIVILTGRGKP